MKSTLTALTLSFGAIQTTINADTLHLIITGVVVLIFEFLKYLKIRKWRKDEYVQREVRKRVDDYIKRIDRENDYYKR